MLVGTIQSFTSDQISITIFQSTLDILLTDFLKSKVAKSQTLIFQFLVFIIKFEISSGLKKSSKSSKETFISLSWLFCFIDQAFIQFV